MENSCFCKFLNDFSVYSVQYLGWVTAVVAAILALTSIVFSQFNERSIQKANDLARGIKTRINENIDLTNNNMVKEDFRHMTYLLMNSSIYKKTLFLFEGLSYFIVFLWWLSVFGYINNAETLADKILIFLATILISIPFLYLPDILKHFNKNQPIKMDKNDQLDIIELIRFMGENTPLNERNIISDFLNPKIRIELKNRKLIVHNTIDVDTVNFTIIFVIKGNQERISFNIEKNKNGIHKTFFVKPLEDDGPTYDDGLYKKIKSMVGCEVTIFLCKDQTDYTSFKGEIKSIEGNIEVFIKGNNNQTLDNAAINQKNLIAVQPSLGEPKKYNLVEK